MTTSHVSIQDGTFTLPTSVGGNSFSRTFDARGLNNNVRPFLSYRVNSNGGSVQLHIFLNGIIIVNDTFNSEPVSSLNEIFDTGVLRAVGNNMTVIRNAGPGSCTISDIIICYSAN